MFALIIAIIAIALTVYLAVSTLFYGGDALSNGSARAIASSFINQGQQINGGHTLYKNDNAGAVITDLNQLVTGKYLTSVPTPSKGGAWTLGVGADVAGSHSATLSIIKSTGVAAGTAPAPVTPEKSIPDEVCDLIITQAAGGQTFGCDKKLAGALDNTVWYRM